MASAAQIEADRLNVDASCGPEVPKGKARSSRNHLKFGLLSPKTVSSRRKRRIHEASKALWKDLNPVGSFDEAYIGIADAHRVIKGLAANERLKSQFFMPPIGIDPLNQTIRQSIAPAVCAAGVGQALSPGNRNLVGPPSSLCRPWPLIPDH